MNDDTVRTKVTAVVSGWVNIYKNRCNRVKKKLSDSHTGCKQASQINLEKKTKVKSQPKLSVVNIQRSQLTSWFNFDLPYMPLKSEIISNMMCIHFWFYLWKIVYLFFRIYFMQCHHVLRSEQLFSGKGNKTYGVMNWSLRCSYTTFKSCKCLLTGVTVTKKHSEAFSLCF